MVYAACMRHALPVPGRIWCLLRSGGPGKGALLARLTLGVASTFPPREDGIATFTRDLLTGVCGTDTGITAITDHGSYYTYPRQVRWEIAQDDPESYAAAGHALARAKVALVSLQHEFGLWGDQGTSVRRTGSLCPEVLMILHIAFSYPPHKTKM